MWKTYAVQETLMERQSAAGITWQEIKWWKLGSEWISTCLVMSWIIFKHDQTIIQRCPSQSLGDRPLSVTTPTARVARTFRRNTTSLTRKLKKQDGFLVSKSLKLPAAPPWAGGVIWWYSQYHKKKLTASLV